MNGGSGRNSEGFDLSLNSLDAQISRGFQIQPVGALLSTDSDHRVLQRGRPQGVDKFTSLCQVLPTLHSKC